MPARSIKRPADSQDSIGVQAPAKVKLPKLEHNGHDDEFSQIVKGRFQSYTRTGQACDRCKVRKIRCDANPLGCSQCKTQNHPCTSTNRVTGLPERRGYTQELEREKAERDAYIDSLERILIDKGIEVKPKDSQYPPGTIVDEGGGITQDTRPFWSQVDNVWVKELPNTSSFAPSFPRNLLESRPEDSHLGLGANNALLSSLKGTRLSILGMAVDVGSLEEPDSDEPPDGSMEPIYNKSTQAFLRSSMRVNPPLEVALPERQDAFNYSEMYFRTLYNFLPTLHRPTFMKLLARIYDEPEFKPSVAELVIIHMLFATIYFQFGVRNWQDAEQRTNLNEMSNRHYHFALSKLYELRCGQDLTSLQAIAMIAAHTRAFPKPGAASLISNIALQRALEMNLHRESRKPGDPTNLEHEMRKRVWWAILTVYIAVTGRLGRPMPIAVEEFDVGYPEAIADEFLTEGGVNTQEIKPCPYEIGIAGFKVIPIFMEMFSNIYCVRRDARSYVTVVNALDAQIRDWENDLPEGLKLSQVSPASSTYLNALYAKAFYLEFRLCLRHPSATMGNNKQMMADNTRICEELGREMLGIQQKIQQMKSLDTTWYQISVHTAAIFSMLAANWERRENITAADIAQLRKDMDGWISILEEIGNLIGSGPRISTEIDRIIRNTIKLIERDMHGKSSKGVATDPALKQDGSPPNYSFSATTLLNGANQAEAPNTGFFHDPSIQYPQLGYGDQGQNGIPPQSYNDPLFYQTQNAAQAAMAATTAQQTNPLMTYSSHVPQVNPGDMWPRANANNSWYNWSNAMSDTSQATSTLMSLRDEPVQELAQVTSAGAINGVLSWPETTYTAHPGNMNGS